MTDSTDRNPEATTEEKLRVWKSERWVVRQQKQQKMMPAKLGSYFPRFTRGSFGYFEVGMYGNNYRKSSAKVSFVSY